MDHSPTPWALHRTGSHLGIKDARGAFVIRKTVSGMSRGKTSAEAIAEYDALLANFNYIIASVNRR